MSAAIGDGLLHGTSPNFQVYLTLQPFHLQYISIYTMLILRGIGSGQRQLIAVTCIAEHA